MVTAEYGMMLLSPHIHLASSDRECATRESSSSESCGSNSSAKSDNCMDDVNDKIPKITDSHFLSTSPSSSLGRCLDYGKCVESCAAYGRTCPLSAQAASLAANRRMESIVLDSHLFHGFPPHFPKTISRNDLILGEKLGEGGFCNAHACAIRGAPFDESCAVKFLRPQIKINQKTFEHGAADLANEAFFLARLDHPNIVKLRAVVAGSVESNIVSGTDTGFFLVIDRLVETLEQRIQRWRTQMDEIPHSLFYRMSKEFKDTQKALLKERLQVALNIASVMSYLHSLNVAYRDLKPDNLGFDRNGTLKLFDLGLCKEEKTSIVCKDGKYRMTGQTGSRRYMAPEVARAHPYDKSVDVYSFGVVLWELCSLEKPFSGYCSKKHLNNVVIGGERPKMDHAHTFFWPVMLQNLIKSCWSCHADDRPTFEVVKEQLGDILEDLSVVDSEKTRSRSTGSREDASKKSPLMPIPKLNPLSGLSGSLRTRSLGLKRQPS